MRILSFLEKGSRPATKVETAPAITESADHFESYVKERIFASEHFTLLEQTHRFKPNQKPSPKTSLDPDFKFLDKRTAKEFWVEVKFLSEEYGGRIFWCTEDQLRRYVTFHKKTPTFILLGIGADPTSPESIYLLSMTQARYACLFESVVRNFEIPFNQPLSSQLLWNR